LSGGSKPSFKEAAAAYEKDKEHNIVVDESSLQSISDTFFIFSLLVSRGNEFTQNQIRSLAGIGHLSPERFFTF
jgi:hypothetical protein